MEKTVKAAVFRDVIDYAASVFRILLWRCIEQLLVDIFLIWFEENCI
jgi:hypothetical protein